MENYLKNITLYSPHKLSYGNPVHAYEHMIAITTDAAGKNTFLFILEMVLPSLGAGAQPR